MRPWVLRCEAYHFIEHVESVIDLAIVAVVVDEVDIFLYGSLDIALARRNFRQHGGDFIVGSLTLSQLTKNGLLLVLFASTLVGLGQHERNLDLWCVMLFAFG